MGNLQENFNNIAQKDTTTIHTSKLNNQLHLLIRIISDQN